MNKNHYRLIYNRARNIMMVVAECVRSHSAGSNANSTIKQHQLSDQIINQTANQTNSQPLTLRPLSFSVMLALGMVGFIPNTLTLNTAHADPVSIIADQAAAANQRPMVIQAANGVPLVNIQTPSSAGVSRNTYSQFDVNGHGVILNNSRTNVQTQLGGFVQDNPYLATGTARVILNEVNSQNPSYLNGYVELAGSRAQVIIANPAGISCQGCGFINTSVATLTTGTPIINSGDLIGYRVGGGIINFLGTGLDASQTDYTNILARAINVNAGIWAQNLNMVTGSNQVNVASNGDITNISSISPNTTQPDGSANPTPNFAIDVAALGGMYAGKIHLIGTEAGVGVRNAGYIGASVGEVTIDVNGNLTNSTRIHANTHTNIQANTITNTGGTITTGQHLNMQANSLTGDGTVLAGGDASITLNTDYTHSNTGELQADGNLTLTSTGNITNQAKLLAGNTLTLNAANITNTATGEISGLATHINTTQGGIGRLGTGTLTNRGLIDGSNTFIHTNTLHNNGTGSLFGHHIAIAANTLNNQQETGTAAVIAARSRLDLGATTINNLNGSLIFSAGELHIGGSLDANHQASSTAGQPQATTLINQGATIEALGNLTANVADSQNLNAGLTTQTAFVGSTAYHQFTPRGQSVILEVADYPGAQIGNFNMSWRSAGPYTFREYYRYLYTGNTSETQVLSSAPAKLLSGSNMTLTGNITNSDSKIIAGGALDVTGATINNHNTQGQTTTSYSGTLFYYDYDGNESCGDPGDGCYDISANPYNPANNITSFNLATTQAVQNTAPASVGAASGTTVATFNSNTLPTNSLFTPTTNPTAGYLIETNPRFANYRTWLSSDYMLAQLSYDPATQTKRLGDGFYEQRLIREQINQLTGQRFLAGYADEEAQYQALMQHGITAASSFKLTHGIALSAAQVAQLTSDIVWLVEQSVTLPNGTVTKVLVPRVYAKLQAGDISNTGALLAGNSVNLNLTSDATNSGGLFNSGTIGSRTLLALNTNNLHNLGGIISGHDVQLSASQDIHNIGGSITAQNSLTLNAGRDINVQSTTQSSANQVGASSFTRTNLDRVAGLYVTNPLGAGLLVASAGNDLHLDAAQLINAAPTGAGNSSATNLTLLKAGNNLSLGTVQIAEQNNSIRNPKNYLKQGSTQDIGTDIQTAGDITLTAGNDLNAKAASISSGDSNNSGGTLTGLAGNNITIESGTQTSNMSAARYVKKSGSFSSKKTTTRDTFNDSTSIGSNLSANAIHLVAGAVVAADGNVSTRPAASTTSSPVILSAAKNPALGNIAITGSNVVATQDVNLNASGNIAITAATDTHTETHYKKVKQSGLSTSGASVTLGSSQLTNTNDSQQVIHVASTIGSIEGNVNINAGKVYNQTGSDILTPQGDINIAAQSVTIQNATDTYASQQTMKYKQSGITLAVSSSALNLAQNVASTAQGTIKSDGTGNKMLNALQTYANASTLIEQKNAIVSVAKAGETQGAADAAGVRASISIGSSKTSSTSSTNATTSQDSLLKAGGDINIKATQDSINVVGSEIKATQNVTLDAAKDINLIASADTEANRSKNKSSSASIGVSFGVGKNTGFM